LDIQQRILKFVTRTNWYLFVFGAVLGMINLPQKFAIGFICGGLIVTVNFHLLYRTLSRSLVPGRLSSHRSVLAKYYIRFTVSGLIIFFLISQGFVDPFGLLVGLSVVVVSITLATMCELTKRIFREAV